MSMVQVKFVNMHDDFVYHSGQDALVIQTHIGYA